MDLMRYVAIKDYGEVDPQDKRKASIAQIWCLAEIMRLNNAQARKNQNILTLIPILEKIKTYKETLLSCPVEYEEVKAKPKLRMIKNNAIKITKIASVPTKIDIPKYNVFTVMAGGETKYIRQRLAK